VYAVHSISVHPGFGTFSTTGALRILRENGASH